MRRLLSNIWLIHGLVLLGLFALLGVIVTGNLYILLGMALSFLGALCGAFIRVIDAAREKTDPF
ncbi:MAG: hypothetical protein AB1Z19_08230 [Eubacteriales bacterium]